MSFIDRSYFEQADLLVPGLEKSTGANKLQEFIDKYEPEYLKNILGYTLYKAFIAAIDASSDDETLASKWKDLRDGAEYVSCGVTKKWEGFLNESFTSPIANYVYYWWLRYNASKTTVSGEKESQNTGAKTVSSIRKQVRVYNDMVRMNESLVDFLNNKKDDNGDLVYPEFVAKNLNWDAFCNMLSTISGI